MLMDRPLALIIEDDGPTRLLLRELLEDEGFDVRATSSGSAGLDYFLMGDVDLVLLDIRLPDMNGIELCRHLRAQEQARRIPVLLLSASHEDVQGYALSSGADALIAKPFDVEELLRQVRGWAGGRLISGGAASI